MDHRPGSRGMRPSWSSMPSVAKSSIHRVEVPMAATGGGAGQRVPVRGARQQDSAYEHTARWGASARDAGLDHRPCLIMRSRESEP
ncbi:hypothetical protein [Streptomyces sp. NPDC088727]|uniref:hypothetical protein n=1 Tax=Streptomyces sp. NPDC088727 TaxID=3365875 RepID=UPI003816E701